jgi:hypothetical protein
MSDTATAGQAARSRQVAVRVVTHDGYFCGPRPCAEQEAFVEVLRRVTDPQRHLDVSEGVIRDSENHEAAELD